MALAYCDISETQTAIASYLRYISGVGTPARNITHLAVLGVKVAWHELGVVADLQPALATHSVPIVFLRTGELPYWDYDTPHAVVVIGVEAGTVYVNDPAFSQSPIPVASGDFQLAWDEFDGQWASIQCLSG